VFDHYSSQNKSDPNDKLHAAASPKIWVLPVGTSELMHTSLRDVILGERALPDMNWNSLTRHMHTLAKKNLGSFEALRRATKANIRDGRVEVNGYRFIPEAGVSVQGTDAIKSCESSFMLARAMNMPLSVTFEWRQKEDAAHPGETGLIQWQPPSR